MRNLVLKVAALSLMVPIVSAAQGQNAQRRGGRNGQLMEVVATDVLKLTEQQRPKFVEINRRFNEREASLFEEERTARTSLRNLLCSGDTTRGPDMSRAIEQVLDIQKRRHQLIEEQQRELATVLTPYQRARFMGTREFLRDRLGGPGGPGGRGRGMGGPPPGQRGGRGGPGGPPDGQRGGPPPDMCAGPPPR
jgi:Spy/CpxP family protein refolding chaperone